MEQTLATGPYMIGLLFVIWGLVQKYLPPKTINTWYGPRAPSARTNQKTWDEANRFSAMFMIRAGTAVFIGGFIIYMIAIYFKADPGILKTLAYTILFGGALGIGALTSVYTEKHLQRNFKITKKAPKRK